MTSPPPGRPGKKPGLAKRQPLLVWGGAAIGAIVLIALAARAKGSTASSSGGGGTTGYTDTGTATPYNYGGGYGIPDYSSQMSALQQQLAQITAAQNEQEQDIAGLGRKKKKKIPVRKLEPPTRRKR